MYPNTAEGSPSIPRAPPTNGSVMLTSPAQPVNAPSAILSASGTTISFKPVQPPNARVPIDTSPLAGSTTLRSDVYPAKALGAIAVSSVR